MAADRNIIDFDHHSEAYRANWARLADERLRDAPVAWTAAHGGYWVISKYEDVKRAVSDPETFTSEHNSPGRPWSKGVLIPELPYVLALSESDPPVHTARRMIEAPFFAPKAVRSLTEVATQHVADAIKRVRGRGELDFAYDFAMRVTAKTTMELVGLDPEQWEVFMLSAHRASVLPTDHPDYPLDAIRKVQQLMREVLAARRENPSSDIASAIATRSARGVPLTEPEQVGMLSAVIFGGFGTTTAATLHALLWLQERPELHQRLLTEDDFMDSFIEEMMRIYPPNHGTARTVVKDVELRGQQLRQGDRVLLSWVAANRDPEVFESPGEVRFDRPNGSAHFGFGGAHHRCLGAPLARVEIRHMLRAVFTHLPDYAIQRERIELYPSFANTAGFSVMPATFTPSRAG